MTTFDRYNRTLRVGDVVVLGRAATRARARVDFAIVTKIHASGRVTLAIVDEDDLQVVSDGGRTVFAWQNKITSNSVTTVMNSARSLIKW